MAPRPIVAIVRPRYKAPRCRYGFLAPRGTPLSFTKVLVTVSLVVVRPLTPGYAFLVSS